MKIFGKFILKFWIPLFIILLIITVFFGLNIKKLKMEENEDTWFSKNDRSLKIYNEYQDIFNIDELIIIAYDSDNIFNQEELTYLNYLVNKFEEIPNIEEVTSITNVDDIKGSEYGMDINPLIEEYPQNNDEINFIKKRIDFNPFIKGNLISDDYKTISIAIEVSNIENSNESERITNEVISNIKSILKNESIKTGRVFHIGGDTVTDTEVNIMMGNDIAIFFPLCLIIGVIILFILYRKILTIIFPMVSVIIALIWTIGLKGFLNSPITPISTTIFPLITVIGIATSIHLINQYILTFKNTKDKNEAITNTFQKAGIPCFFTAITTAIGFASLVVSKVSGIKHMGLFCAFGIMSSFLISMIIIPVSMKFMNINTNNKKNLILIKMENLLSKIASLNLKYPKTILIACFIVVCLMLIGVSRIKVEGSLIKYLKKSTQLRKDAEFMDKNLVGIANIDIVLYGHEDTFKDPEILNKINDFQNTFHKHPNVSASYSVVDFLKLIYRALNGDKDEYYTIPRTHNAVAQSMLLYEMSGGDETPQYITQNYDTTRISMRMKQMSTDERNDLISGIKTYLDNNFKNIKYDLTGFEQLVSEHSKNIVSTQIQSMALAFIIILIFMIVLFGFKGGLVSILPNIFPIAFVFGIMGFFFNLSTGTSIIAAIAIGIVVDDTIHYFTHFKREIIKTGDSKVAMKNSLKNVGIALCFTSIVLILGFSTFLFSQTKIITDFGILSIVAIFFALIGDLFIGPILLSKFNVFKKKEVKEENTVNLTINEEA